MKKMRENIDPDKQLPDFAYNALRSGDYCRSMGGFVRLLWSRKWGGGRFSINVRPLWGPSATMVGWENFANHFVSTSISIVAGKGPERVQTSMELSSLHSSDPTAMRVRNSGVERQFIWKSTLVSQNPSLN